MKKFIYLFSVSLMCLCLFSSCSADSPGDVAKKFMGYTKDGNSDKMLECLVMKEGIDASEKEQAKLAIAALAKKANTSVAAKGGMKAVEVESETIEEDEKATVVLKIIYGDETEDTNSFNLEKHDGKWKIKL